MNIHFDSCYPKFAKFQKHSRTKDGSSRLMAWAFTRLGMQGVWRYLDNVDEVTCPRFFMFILDI